MRDAVDDAVRGGVEGAVRPVDGDRAAEAGVALALLAVLAGDRDGVGRAGDRRRVEAEHPVALLVDRPHLAGAGRRRRRRCPAVRRPGRSRCATRDGRGVPSAPIHRVVDPHRRWSARRSPSPSARTGRAGWAPGVVVPPVPWMTVRPERRSLHAMAGGAPCSRSETSRTVRAGPRPGRGRVAAAVAGARAAARASVVAASRAVRAMVSCQGDACEGVGVASAAREGRRERQPLAASTSRSRSGWLVISPSTPSRTRWRMVGSSSTT